MQKIFTAALFFLVSATAAIAAPEYTSTSPPQPCGTLVCQPGYQCCKTVNGPGCAKLPAGAVC
ncbi:hypothetical protein CPB83DRAFT_852459 [Crepidotus variabilis]|uniref:Uncharacterized protein n=1 Tax=Crepidotus variabilis TaxID=179855 RepID=A0A9P6EIT8_9AGAR|nr:hypothetical protein CPB83DRAFT_852459 [Crepidotus variabilis]